jgi:S1-C subfamily serine protease
MEELQLLEAVERYLSGEMPPEEVTNFEQLRKSDPSVDQMVVQHAMFLHQLTGFGENKSLKHNLQNIHQQLLQDGEIKEALPKAKVVSFLKKYRKVLAAAACIAGVIALSISGLVAYFTPKRTVNEIEQLKRELYSVKVSQKQTQNEINSFKNGSLKPPVTGKFGGTGFLIDGKGYLVTSAHVVAKSDSVYVLKGENFYKAAIVIADENTDIAILKIIDDRFQPKALPYAIHKGSSDLGEPIFTLGFPRTDMVYNQGYLSAKTGYNGDSSTYQITISVNPGNSGGPIFNEAGEVIGVLSGKQTTAEGVVFSSKAKNILKVLEEAKKADSTNNIKLNYASSLKNMDRKTQVKKIEDCIFNVLSY